MKIASLITKAIILCAVVLFSIFKTNTFYQELKKPQNFDFYFDRLISSENKDQIKFFFNLNKVLDLNELAQKFIQDFDFSYNVTLKTDFNSTKVFIKIARPIININNKFVVTDTKKVALISSYNKDTVSNLPLILVNCENIDKKIVNFLLGLDYQIYKKYDVELNDCFNVYLKDKKEKRFLVLTNLNFIPDKKILQICKKLLNEKAVSVKKNKNLVADIRFNKQIVLFQI